MKVLVDRKKNKKPFYPWYRDEEFLRGTTLIGVSTASSDHVRTARLITPAS
jgi:hypothetical protein